MRERRTEEKGGKTSICSYLKKMSSHIRWLVIQRRNACLWAWCTIMGYPRVDAVCCRTGGKFGIELIIVSLETVWWAFCTCERAFSICLCHCDQCSMASEEENDRAAHIHYIQNEASCNTAAVCMCIEQQLRNTVLVSPHWNFNRAMWF